MIEYSFAFGSSIDMNLTRAWEEQSAIVWEEQYDTDGWIEFLESLPGVVKAQVEAEFDLGRTDLQFDSETELTMFILRWS